MKIKVLEMALSRAPIHSDVNLLRGDVNAVCDQMPRLIDDGKIPM